MMEFAVSVKEGQDLSTLYWLPKLHKRSYKALLIANLSSCTVTELFKLLTSSSCLTATRIHVIIKCCDKVCERSSRICFGL